MTILAASAEKDTIRQTGRTTAVILWRWWCFGIFVAGWWLTASYWQNLLPEFAVLLAASALACALLLSRLRGAWWRELHLWTILLVFLVAYYAKLFLLIHMWLIAQSSQSVGVGFEAVLADPPVLMRSFEVASLCFISLCLVGFVLVGKPRADARVFPAQAGVKTWNLLSRPFVGVLGALVLVSGVVLAIEVVTGIGFAGPTSAALPFHLAGILVAVQNVVVPAVAYQLIWMCDQRRTPGRAHLVMVFLLLHAVSTALVSTSKIPAVFAALGLIVIWALGRSMSRLRWAVILAGPPLLALFNAVLSTARSLRGLGGLGVLDSLPLVLESIFGTGTERFGEFAFALINRFSGIDGLSQVVAYQPPGNLEWTWWVLFGSGSQVSDLFGELVLGLPMHLEGTAFSPSLLGEFYLLNGTLYFTLGATLVYLGFWQTLFRWIARLPLLAAPAILTAAFLDLVLMTSDGGLQALPSHAVTLAMVAVAAECVGWYLAGRLPFEVQLQRARASPVRSRL